MNHSTNLPQLVAKGVFFTVPTSARVRECLVSKEALMRLSGLKDTNPDPLEVFYAFQPAIHDAAYRMIRAGVADQPLVLGPEALVAGPGHQGNA